MKIIFLDIDGVINSERSFIGGINRIDRCEPEMEADYSYAQRLALLTVDPIACAIVNKILINVDAHIVLTSTHRNYFNEPNKLEDIQTYLTTLGILGERCIGFTENSGKKRGYEIRDWLLAHPEVSHYVILDDNDDMLPGQMDNFVHVDSAIGLDSEDYRLAREILGEPDSSIILM